MRAAPTREKASPAILREVRLGRGKGAYLAKVIDLGLVGVNGKSLHVLDLADRPVCKARGEVREIDRGVDARVVRVGQYPVCVTCLDLLPPVTSPVRESEVLQ